MPPKKRCASRNETGSPNTKNARTLPSEAPITTRKEKVTATEAFLRIVKATPVEAKGITDTVLHASASRSQPAQTAHGGTARTPSVDDRFLQHLASLVHGMILVTLTEKAQQGLTNSTRFEGIDALTEEEIEAEENTGRAPKAVLPSARVDHRWLDAVTRYCNTRVTIDDVAKVAVAFPKWVSVKWGVRLSSRLPDRAFAAALGDEFSSSLPPVLPTQRRNMKATHLHTSGASSLQNASALAVRTSDQTVLSARVYLFVTQVPPVDEAVKAAKATEAAFTARMMPNSPSWREMAMRCTALEALVRQERNEADPKIEAICTDENGAAGAEPHPRDKRSSPRPQSQLNDEDCTAEDKALLATLSGELRNALSAEKLRGVLAQMKKDQSNEDIREFARIEREQEEERVLSTYTHIRSLFGPNKTYLSAAKVLHSLNSESRFDDQRRRLPQLALILQLEGSGLSALRFSSDEAESDASDVKPERVDDLAKCTEDDLEQVLIYLDRGKGSVQAVLESLKSVQQRYEKLD